MADRRNGLASNGNGPACGWSLLTEQAAVSNLRVVEHLGQLVHRPGRHVGRVEQREPMRHRVFAQAPAQQCEQGLAVHDAPARMIEARVAGPGRAVERTAQRGELPVVARDDEDHPVAALEGLRRHAAEAAVAAPLRHLTRDKVVHREVRQRGHAAVEQRHVNELALARDLVAMAQRREDRDGRVLPGEDVDQADADLHRLVGVAVGGHDAAHRLEHAVVAGTLGIRAALAEAGDRAVEEPRVQRAQRCGVEAVLRERADAKILEQHVALRREAANDVLPFPCRMVYGDGLLAAVAGEEERGGVGAAAVAVLQKRRAVGAAFVARARALDLDDLGAEIGQRLRRQRRGEHAAEVENADARESAHQTPRNTGLRFSANARMPSR